MNRSSAGQSVQETGIQPQVRHGHENPLLPPSIGPDLQAWMNLYRLASLDCEAMQDSRLVRLASLDREAMQVFRARVNCQIPAKEGHSELEVEVSAPGGQRSPDAIGGRGGARGISLGVDGNGTAELLNREITTTNHPPAPTQNHP